MKAKKIFALLLAVVMVLGTMAIPTFAATGTVTVNGTEVADFAAAVAKLDGMTGDVTIALSAGEFDLGGAVQIKQVANQNIIISGVKGETTIKGALWIFGNARKSGDETVLVENITFDAVNNGDIKVGDNVYSACIYSPDRGLNNSYSYSHNVTVSGCTFKDSGVVTLDSAAITTGDGGDDDWTIRNCVVENTIHSLCQVQNIEGENGLVIDNCEVYSKNGINLNSTLNASITNCTIEVQGYAVRSGVKSGGNIGVEKNITLTNNTLSSQALDGDPVIELRASADVVDLDMSQNVVKTADGGNHISVAVTDASNIVVDADYNYWGQGNTALEGPATDGAEPDVNILIYYKDEAKTETGVAGLLGEGTETSPLVINNVDDLIWFKNDVNKGNDYAGKYVVLADDITLAEEWTAIGNGTRSGSSYAGAAFKGIFDGANKTISGLTMTAAVTSENEDDTFGLFGVVAGGTVKNLVLDNVAISGNGDNVGAAVALAVEDATIDNITVNGSVAGADGTGGVVGRMTIEGTISNCTNNAAVSSYAAGGIVSKAYYNALDKTMTISDNTNNGVITGEYAAGGIAAYSAANIENNTNTAAVTATDKEAGGIVAEQAMSGVISGNTNSGTVTSSAIAGGIVGWVRYNQGATNYPKNETVQVINNVNSGNIVYVGTGSSATGMGGIVGEADYKIVVSGNENTAEKISGGRAAGLVGNTYADSAENADFTITNNVTTTALENITGDPVSLYVNGTATPTENSQAYEAKIVKDGKEVKYATLRVAIDEAIENGGTVTLMKDIVLDTYEMTSSISRAGIFIKSYGERFVPEGEEPLTSETLVLDLAGHKLTGTAGNTGNAHHYWVIMNRGNLIINDSVGGGVISNESPANTEGWAMSVTIGNYGSLTVNGGTIQNLVTASSNCTPYVVTNTSADPTNQPNTTVTTATLDLNGGSIISSGATALYMEDYGAKYTNSVSIVDGVTISGKTALKMSAMSAPIDVEITGGTFNGAFSIKSAANASGFISGGLFSESFDESYLADGFALAANGAGYYTLVAADEDGEATVTNGIKVVLEPASTEIDNNEWKVYLETNEAGKVIYEFGSAELKFNLVSDDLAYQIEGTDKIAVTGVPGAADAYFFNKKDGADLENELKIHIATITLDGYGDYEFKVDESYANIVNTAVQNTHIKRTYTEALDGATDSVLVLGTTGEVTRGQGTATLKVTVDFSEPIGRQDSLYNLMKVAVTGSNGEEHVKYIGTAYTNELWNKTVGVGDDNKAVIEFDVTANYTYTVVVSAPGYRTARYTTGICAKDMTRNLYFWNDWRRDTEESPLAAIETDAEGNEISAELTNTFLAGDIVADDDMNIYDLSAVVAYAGTVVNGGADYAYARYDLNRDLRIDSEDIDIVLNAWRGQQLAE